MISRLLNLKPVWILAAIIAIGAFIYHIGKDKQLEDLAPEGFDPTLNEVRGKLTGTFLNLAQEAEKRFDIYRKAGDDAQAYIQAGLAANGYRRAGDEENYRRWNEIKEEYARRTGAH